MSALQKRIAGYEEEEEEDEFDQSRALTLTSGSSIGRRVSSYPGSMSKVRGHVTNGHGRGQRGSARMLAPSGSHAPLSEQTRRRRQLMNVGSDYDEEDDELSLFDSKSMDNYSDDEDESEELYRMAGAEYDTEDDDSDADDMSGDEVYYAGDAAVHAEAQEELDRLMQQLREEYPSEGQFMDSESLRPRFTRTKKGKASHDRKREEKAYLKNLRLQRKRHRKETARRERLANRQAKGGFLNRAFGKFYRKPTVQAAPQAANSPLDQARTATEYHEIASYMTDPRPSEVDWEETTFPFSLHFSLAEAAKNPKVAQWNLIDIVKNNKAIRKLMGSGNYLGDVVVHDIHHNAPVSLGIRASMQATTNRPSDNSEIFYAANVYPTKVSMSPVHVQINKSLPNIPQSGARMALRSRPAAVAPTFMDRYATQWSLSQVRDDAELQSGKGVALVSSKSPLVGLLLAKNILHPNVVNERTSVPMDENMVKDGLDMIEADHNTVLRLSDLSAMRLSAVRVSGDHWEHSDEITNDLRLNSKSELATIGERRKETPFMIQGSVTVTHGRILPHQPTPEELAQVQHNAQVQQQAEAVNQQQILVETAAQTIQAHDYNAMNDAAKKAGILVHDPQAQQEAELAHAQRENEPAQVQRFQDPETGVVYDMVPVAQPQN